ncbi:hypothetical protein DASB73_016980 [Starmerella bacillaris]|uniref:non-specific serine/threonine protein kinase n=1 Tax=Starmerella bacillaris TaxID=1247836 RepID=A0AAV5RGS9_STABA|nr:hypothetical protein DASB73_016980 [Starmerella bacillaris]
MPSSSYTVSTPQLSQKNMWGAEDDNDSSQDSSLDAIPDLTNSPLSPQSVDLLSTPNTPPQTLSALSPLSTLNSLNSLNTLDTLNPLKCYKNQSTRPPLSPDSVHEDTSLSRSNSVKESRTVGALSLLRPIGAGAFSKTYRAVGYNRVFAVKSRLPSTDISTFAHERQVLMKLGNHEGVVKLYATLGDADHLVLDLYDYDLKKLVNLRTHENDADVDLFDFGRMMKPVIGIKMWTYYAQQLLSAMQFIHSRNIIHADLKPENVLCTSDNKLVIADFSAAIDIDSQTASVLSQELGASVAMSPVYTDPEVRHGLCLPSFQSDYYSLGLVLAFCATNQEPYSGARSIPQRMLWMDKIQPLDSYDVESQQRLSAVRATISKLLSRDASQIPSVIQ